MSVKRYTHPSKIVVSLFEKIMQELHSIIEKERNAKIKSNITYTTDSNTGDISVVIKISNE